MPQESSKPPKSGSEYDFFFLAYRDMLMNKDLRINEERKKRDVMTTVWVFF